MSNVLIVLNTASDSNLLKNISPFTFLKKEDVIIQSHLIYNAPAFIIFEENAQNRKKDIDIITLLKGNPVFAAVPLLILTTKQTAEETLVYFEHGATTCVLKPTAADEWLNIINNMPAYWQEAA
jgi:DNA-binding NarL/FixJ family response regulator